MSLSIGQQPSNVGNVECQQILAVILSERRPFIQQHIRAYLLIYSSTSTTVTQEITQENYLTDNLKDRYWKVGLTHALTVRPSKREI